MYLPSGAPVRAFKAAIQKAVKSRIRKPLECPVMVEISAQFRRPPSHLRADGRPKAGAPMHPGRNLGDLDNIAKAVLDALNGIAFDDDAQVTRLLVFKDWGAAEKTTLGISPIGSTCDARGR